MAAAEGKTGEESVKFYLAEQVPFALNVTVSPQDGEVNASASSTPTFLLGVDSVKSVTGGGGDPLLQKELSEKLNLALQDREIGWIFNVRCRKSYVKAANGVEQEYEKGVTEFRITSILSLDSNRKPNRDLLPRLQQLLGGESAFLQVEFDEWKDGNKPPIKFTTKEMPITSASKRNIYVCRDDTHYPAIDNLVPGNTRNITGKMSFILGARGCGPSEREKAGMLKRMLEEELAPDAVIVASNGAELKCHRGILAMHSDVFRATFGTAMQESETGKIEMPDMSEDGVRAFLAYLYHWDLTKAEESSAVALELLKAGHKYNIRYLENAMRNKLLSKPDSWYEVDVAVKLFLFVRHLDAQWEALKKKAVMVMKKNSADLENSATFQDLFEKDPKAAMDFYRYYISVATFELS